MGFNVVRSTGIALAAPFQPDRCPGFDAETYWSDALLSADAASWLVPVASATKDTEPGTARAAGLLHNLGLLWLADQLPKEVNQAFSRKGAADAPSIRERLAGVTNYRPAVTWVKPGTSPGHWLQQWPITPTPTTGTAIGRPPTWSVWAVSMVSVIRQARPWEPAGHQLGRLGVTESAAERVLSQLEKQLVKTRELAKALFNS